MQNEQRRMKWCKFCIYFNSNREQCKLLKVPVKEYDCCDRFKGGLLDYKN